MSNTITLAALAQQMIAQVQEQLQHIEAPKAAPLVHDYKQLAINGAYNWTEGGRTNSMGSYLGSLAACGYSAEQLEEAWKYVMRTLIKDFDLDDPDVKENKDYVSLRTYLVTAQTKYIRKGAQRRTSIGSAEVLTKEHGGDIDATNKHLEEHAPFAVVKQVGDKVTVSVILPKLADYIAEHESYVVCGGTDKAQVYWRDAGVYKAVGKNWIYGVIADYLRGVNDTCASVKNIAEVYQLLLSRHDRLISGKMLNNVENAINYKNGVLIMDADSSSFVPYRSDYINTGDDNAESLTHHDYDYRQLDAVMDMLGLQYYPTTQLPCDYHAEAAVSADDVNTFCAAREVYDGCKCPVFLGFLNQLCGMPAEDNTTAEAAEAIRSGKGGVEGVAKAMMLIVRNNTEGINTYDDAQGLKFLLLMWIGLTLSGFSGFLTKKLLLLCGKGNTGKTQYIKLLEGLVGEQNAAAVSLYNLTSSRFGLSDMIDKRLTFDADTSHLKLADISIIKSITGGDNLSIERKGKDAYTAQYRGVLVLAANDLPKFGGDTGDHVYERIISVKCDNVVPAEQRDPYIVDKMLEEAEAITQLALEALKMQLTKGLAQIDLPACCKAFTEEYKETNDPTVIFLRHCTEPRIGEPAPTDKDTGASVYAAYKDWAQREGHYVVSLGQFKAAAKTIYGGNITCKTKANHGGYSYYTFKLTAGYKQAQREQALQDQRDSLRYRGY